MEKNDYKNPTMCVVEIQQRQHLLDGSPWDPGQGGGNGVHNGVREYRGDSDEGSNSSSNNVWDKEW